MPQPARSDFPVLVQLLLPPAVDLTTPATTEPEHPTMRSAHEQLVEFAAGERSAFEIPYVLLGGSEFQRAVWSVIEQIPFGETMTYAQVAKAAGHPGATRAVGSACSANPLPLLIGCHRMVRSSGELGEYLGGRTLKAQLLSLEGTAASDCAVSTPPASRD